MIFDRFRVEVFRKFEGSTVLIEFNDKGGDLVSVKATITGIDIETNQIMIDPTNSYAKPRWVSVNAIERIALVGTPGRQPEPAI